MFDPISILTISAAIASIISGFNSAKQIWTSLRTRFRRRRTQRAITSEVDDGQLQQALNSTPNGVRDDYAEGRRRFGALFERGDDWSLRGMVNVLINMNRDLIETLRVAVSSVNQPVINFSRICAACLSARSDTQNIFSGLHRRLQSTTAIPQSLTYTINRGRRTRDPSEHLPVHTYAALPSPQAQHYTPWQSVVVGVAPIVREIGGNSRTSSPEPEVSFRTTRPTVHDPPAPYIPPKSPTSFTKAFDTVSELASSLTQISTSITHRTLQHSALVSATVRQLEFDLQAEDGSLAQTVQPAATLRSAALVTQNLAALVQPVTASLQEVLFPQSDILGNAPRISGKNRDFVDPEIALNGQNVERRQNVRSSPPDHHLQPVTHALHDNGLRHSSHGLDANSIDIRSKLKPAPLIMRSDDWPPNGTGQTQTRPFQPSSPDASFELEAAGNIKDSDNSCPKLVLDSRGSPTLAFCKEALRFQQGRLSLLLHKSYSTILCPECNCDIATQPFRLTVGDISQHITSDFLFASHLTSTSATSKRANFACQLCEAGQTRRNERHCFGGRNHLWAHLETHSAQEIMKWFDSVRV